MSRFDVLVLAGASPKGPGQMAVDEGVQRKVEIDVEGRPMLWWTLRALRASDRVGHLVLLGGEQEDTAGIAGPIECLPVQGELMDKVLAGLQRAASINPQAKLVLVASGDLPLLTTEAIDWFIDACLSAEADVYYPVVKQVVMEERFPLSNRTYAPLREGRLCGGDLVLVRVDVALAQQEMVRSLMERRKSPLQQARLVGLWPLIKLVLRRLSLEDAERIAGRVLGIRGKAIVSPYAELAMDVDKPHHLELVRQELAGRMQEGA